jgi:hypothetical protein
MAAATPEYRDSSMKLSTSARDSYPMLSVIVADHP